MKSPSGSNISGFRDLQLAWEDGERIFLRGRSDGTNDQHAVLIALPAADHPTIDTLDRLVHEFELKNELNDSTWAIRPLELVCDYGRTFLVLDDFEGEPLYRLIGTPMELQSFLRLAISISVAIGRLHDRGLV